MSAEATLMAEKTRPVRMTEEAMKLAKIAASYTGENMSDYVCRVVEEAARRDIEQGHASLTKPEPKRDPIEEAVARATRKKGKG